MVTQNPAKIAEVVAVEKHVRMYQDPVAERSGAVAPYVGVHVTVPVHEDCVEAVSQQSFDGLQLGTTLARALLDSLDLTLVGTRLLALCIGLAAIV